MKIWVIIGHIIIGTGPGSDLPVMHGDLAFPTLELCTAWKATMKIDNQECRELLVIRKDNRPR